MAASYNGISLRAAPIIFRSLAAVESAATRYQKHWIVLGEVGEYLLVLPVDANRLSAAGYEIF